MGFFDVVKSIGKYAVDTAIENAEHNQEKLERAYGIGSRLSDAELVSRFKSASGFEKAGYAKVLEERGYLEKDSEGKYQRTGKTLKR